MYTCFECLGVFVCLRKEYLGGVDKRNLFLEVKSRKF